MKPPSNTAEFLEALKAARRLPSDYALAHHYGIPISTVSSYRTGRTVPDDATCVRIAEALDLDPGYVLAQVAAERAARQKNQALADTWHAIARRFGVAALLVLALFFVPDLVSVTSDQARAGFDTSIHYTQLIHGIAALQFALILIFCLWVFGEPEQ